MGNENMNCFIVCFLLLGTMLIHNIEGAMIPAHIQRGLMSPLNCVAARRGYDVCVETGDITKFEGDAVVNAANERLSHGGGVALAFVRTGGQQIQDESDEHVRKFGTLPVAHTAVTGAGAMRAKHLIHVVGPIAASGASADVAKEDQLLRESVLNVLRTARRMCLRSVAIPLISSGIFGFTKERAAKAVVDAVFDFYERPDKNDPAGGSTRLPNVVACDLTVPVPRQVVLIDVDKTSVSAIKNEMKRYLHLAFGHRTEL